MIDMKDKMYDYNLAQHTDMNEFKNEVKEQLKKSQEQNMKEFKDLLIPVMVQVQVNKERFQDLNKKLH